MGIEELRLEIDGVDNEILLLLKERLALALKIADIKKQNQMHVQRHNQN
jgi:chorismate mutase